MSWDNLKPPVAPIDGWSTITPPVNTQAPPAPNAWSSFVQEAKINERWPITRPDLIHDECDMVSDLKEAIWTVNALDSAVVKTGVVNSLNGTKDHFNIDQDGELTRMKEIVSSTQLGPHTYYIAYHNGRWLHAILSGPYDTLDRAKERFVEAYNMMVKDVAFQLAFENKFERSGIYVAQIPLAAKRKGAYGVIS